jgi:hypothetical protein
MEQQNNATKQFRREKKDFQINNLNEPQKNRFFHNKRETAAKIADNTQQTPLFRLWTRPKPRVTG